MKRLGLALVLLLVARPAFAQKTDVPAAEALFEEGRKLMAAGNTVLACEKFAESERLAPSAGAALNLGVCLEKQNKLASAWAAFREASALALQAGQTDREKFARDRAEALLPRVSKMVVNVRPNAETDLLIKRDGVAMTPAQWGTPIPIDPGKHVLEIGAAHKQTVTHPFEIVAEGTVTTIDIPRLANAIEVQAPAPAPPATTIVDNGRALRIIGIGSAVVGAGLMVTGGVFASQASSKEDELSAFSRERGTWDADRQATYDDGERSATLANVFLISGGVLLAAGGVMTVLGITARRSTTTGLLVLPSGGGVRCAF